MKHLPDMGSPVADTNVEPSLRPPLCPRPPRLPLLAVDDDDLLLQPPRDAARPRPTPVTKSSSHLH